MNSYENLMKQKSLRIWIEENEHIHLLNYWFYRYFTDSYYKFLLNNLKLKASHNPAKIGEGKWN